MAGKEGLAAERVRALMLTLVEKLEAEVKRFGDDPPAEPAQRIKFITDAARAGRAIVLAEAAAMRAGQLVEGVAQRNPTGGAEDKDGDGMRDSDISDEQLAGLRARLEQKLAEGRRSPERKGGAGQLPPRAVQPPDDPGLGGRSSTSAPG